MPQDDFTDLQALLRIKRYEAPPPDYFEDFLVEFHQRQRVELLRRPLWRIALDRIGNWVPAMPVLPMPNLAYAGTGALAVLAAVGLVGRQIALSGGPALVTAGTPEVSLTHKAAANTPDRSLVTVASAPAFFAAPLSVRLADRSSDFADDDADEIPAARFARSTAGQPSIHAAALGSRPRYVLESQPVRYEVRSTSF